MNEYAAVPAHDEGNDVHPFAVRPGDILGYEVLDDRFITHRCIHLAKRQIFSPMRGFWFGRQQVFHVMRPYATQTTFDLDYRRIWPRHERSRIEKRIIIPPYPYVWRSYCGKAVFLDWDWRVASEITLHWATAPPWFCRACKAEKL